MCRSVWETTQCSCLTSSPLFTCNSYTLLMRCVRDVSECVGDHTVQLSHQLATLHLQQIHIINRDVSEMCRSVWEMCRSVWEMTQCSCLTSSPLFTCNSYTLLTRWVRDVSERVGDHTVQLSHQLATLHLQQLHIINEMCQSVWETTQCSCLTSSPLFTCNSYTLLTRCVRDVSEMCRSVWETTQCSCLTSSPLFTCNSYTLLTRCVRDVSERVGDHTVQLSHQLATLHLQQVHIINRDVSEMCRRCVGACGRPHSAAVSPARHSSPATVTHY